MDNQSAQPDRPGRVSLDRGSIHLGTVAIEPSRWAAFLGGDDTTEPVAVSEWLDDIAAAGFDGIEVWERHLTAAPLSEIDAVLGHQLPVSVFNSYVSFDDHDGSARAEAADWANRVRCGGIKYNVGNDTASEGAYSERIAEWLELVNDDIALLCECHHGISVAEDPQVAARIFDAAGPHERVQAIVHTHEDPDHIRARFDAYGDRISHVHVNFLDFEAMAAPRLADIRNRVAAQVELLRSLGFVGSWTIEFTHGLLTDNDNPAFLVAQAADDLQLLREMVT